jgi:hypothetical protein
LATVSSRQNLLFLSLLADLCAGIIEPARPRKRGQQPLPLADMVFSTVFKVYSTVSTRRFTCDLQEAYRLASGARGECRAGRAYVPAGRPTGQAPPHMGYFNVNARGSRTAKRFE